MTTTFPISDNLASARGIRGLSVGQLADAAGLASSTVSHVEAGDRLPSIEVLVRLADALSVSTDFLLGRTADVEAGGERAQEMMGKIGRLSAEQLRTFDRFLDTVLSGGGEQETLESVVRRRIERYREARS